MKFDVKQHTGKDREFIRVMPGIQQIYSWDRDKNLYVSVGFRARKSIDGKSYQKVLPSKIKARKYLADIAGGRYDIPSSVSRGITLGELWDDYIGSDFYKDELEITTRDTYEKQWSLKWFDMLRDVEMSKLTPSKLDEWITWMKNNIHMYTTSKTKFKRELDLLQSIFTYYCAYHDDHNFTSPIKPRHKIAAKNSKKKKAKDDDEPIYLDEITFARFINELKKQVHGEGMHLMAMMQYFHALRISEAAVIRGSNINFKDKMITFNEHRVFRRRKNRLDSTEPGLKNGDVKVQPIWPEYMAVLAKLKLSSNWSDGPLFMDGGKHYTYRQIQYAYNRAFTAIGLPSMSTHILRKSGSSLVYRQTGGSREVTKELLGNNAVLDPYIIAQTGRLQDLATERSSKEDRTLPSLDQLGG